MIVDGAREFVGSDSGKAVNAVMEAAKTQKATVEISHRDERIKIKITDIPKHAEATVYLAIAEDNLFTDVKRGENSGRKLEHVSVVRELKVICLIDDKLNNFEIETDFSVQPEWKTENLKLIVFVQENDSRKIIGVNRIAFEKNAKID